MGLGAPPVKTEKVERRLAAILVADMVGYSRLCHKQAPISRARTRIGALRSKRVASIAEAFRDIVVPHLGVKRNAGHGASEGEQKAIQAAS